VAQRHGDPQTEAAAMSYLAYFQAYAGQVEEARAASTQAESISRRGAPPWTLAEVLMIRGQLLRASGRPGDALHALDAAGRTAVEVAHDWAAGSALWIAGKTALDVDDPVRALTYAAKAARVQHADRDLTSWLVSLHLLAGAAAMAGHGLEGARLLGAVSARGARLGFDPAAMDPLDSPRHEAAVAAALDPAEAAAAAAAGAALDDSGILALVDDLVERVDAHAR
jgi:hypothetical protein